MGVVFLLTPAHKQPPAAGVLRSAASLESLDDKGQPNWRLLAARSFTLPSHCRHTPVNAELTAAESGIRALDRVLREVGVIYIYIGPLSLLRCGMFWWCFIESVSCNNMSFYNVLLA